MLKILVDLLATILVDLYFICFLIWKLLIYPFKFNCLGIILMFVACGYAIHREYNLFDVVVATKEVKELRELNRNLRFELAGNKAGKELIQGKIK